MGNDANEPIAMILRVIPVLRERFPNLTTVQTAEIAAQIVRAVREEA